MAKERRPSVVPIYAVGVTWLIWSLVLPLYLPLHWFGSAAASLAVYVLGRSLFWKDRVLIVPDGPEPKEPEAPAQEETGGDPEIAALKKERERALSEMRRLNDNIESSRPRSTVWKRSREKFWTMWRSTRTNAPRSENSSTTICPPRLSSSTPMTGWEAPGCRAPILTGPWERSSP